MNVAAILKGKGREVVSVPSHTTIQDASIKLAERRIGALVVGEGGSVLGIISERDVIRAIAEKGAAALSEPVSAFMTRSVRNCSLDDTLDELMAAMTAGRFRHLPVTEHGGLVGIVSIGDVVKHHIAEVEMEASALREYIVAG